MEVLLREWASHVALAAELCTVICVAVGGLETIARTLSVLVTRRVAFQQARRAVWTGFAAWIVLALEFALAADIARTAIAPTWDDIGRLAAIAVIRTALNYFLERDLEAFNRGPEVEAAAGPRP
jgi:uncharacterized membrane protein